MLSGLRNIVLKELKEIIRNPEILLGMIIFPILMLPLMGAVARVSIQTTTTESLKTLSVGVIDDDSTPLSQMFAGFLRNSPSVAKLVIFKSVEEAKEPLEKSDIIGLIRIPKGFCNNISNNERGILEIYTVFRGGGIFSSAGTSILINFAKSFGDYLVVQKVGEKIPGFEKIVLNPIRVSEKTIIKGEEVSVSSSLLSSLLAQQSFGLVFAPFLLIFLAMQMGVTLTASEKEEKTLETLLTMPIDRVAILIGKLSSVILVSAISSFAFVASWNYYMYSFFEENPQEQISISLEALGLAPTLPIYVITGISLFLTILFSLTLSVLLSSFAEDVRSAQSLTGYLYPVLFIPTFFIMFTNINTLPDAVKIALWLLPFIHPSLTFQAFLNGDYAMPVFGICYDIVLTLLVLYLATRFFSTGKILSAKYASRKEE